MRTEKVSACLEHEAPLAHFTNDDVIQYVVRWSLHSKSSILCVHHAIIVQSLVVLPSRLAINYNARHIVTNSTYFCSTIFSPSSTKPDNVLCSTLFNFAIFTNFHTLHVIYIHSWSAKLKYSSDRVNTHLDVIMENTNEHRFIWHMIAFLSTAPHFVLSHLTFQSWNCFENWMDLNFLHSLVTIPYNLHFNQSTIFSTIFQFAIRSYVTGTLCHLPAESELLKCNFSLVQYIKEDSLQHNNHYI